MPHIPSRRQFCQTIGAGTAAMWLPRAARGSVMPEAVGSPDARLEVGLSKWELETPALVVDLDRLEQNIARMQERVTANGIGVRPHAKTHKCPAIARLQLAAGAVGICVAKLGEAEVMFEHGIEKLLLTTVNATPSKVARAMRLASWCPGFIQAVDNEPNARMLSEAAAAAGVVADVVVDVDPGGHRTGIAPGAPALALAKLVDSLPSLRLRGILCYDGGAQHVDGFAPRRERSLSSLAPAAETIEAMKAAGLDTGIFSGGGTGTYNIDHEVPGFTDVQAGSYLFMDAQYLAIGGQDGAPVYGDFEPSLTVLATVLNAQYDGVATTDAGAKSLTINEPDPIVVGESGMQYRARSDEFGVIRYDSPSRVYGFGDKLEVIVPHCDPVVNLYDWMYGVRGETVEVVWSIAARGRVR